MKQKYIDVGNTFNIKNHGDTRQVAEKIRDSMDRKNALELMDTLVLQSINIRSLNKDEIDLIQQNEHLNIRKVISPKTNLNDSFRITRLYCPNQDNAASSIG